MKHFDKSLFIAAIGLSLTMSSFATEVAKLDPGSKSYTITEDSPKIIVLNLKSEDSNIYSIDNATMAGTGYESYAIAYLGDGKNTVLTGGVGLISSKHKNATSMTLSCGTIEEIRAKAFGAWAKLETFSILNQSTIPTLGEDALPASLKKIVVPKGMADAYAEAEGWKIWKNIIEDEEGVKPSEPEPPTTDPTAIENVKKVAMNLKGNVLTFGEATQATVHDLAGKTVFSGKSEKVVLMQKGVYIVRTEKEARKIVVR